jgi:hypothetical protein
MEVQPGFKVESGPLADPKLTIEAKKVTKRFC